VNSPNIRQVAALAGVSVSTVSACLNRPSRVAAGTLLRVQAAMDELGFVRNESARQLRAGGGRCVGLIVPDMGNPFFTDVARGAEVVLSSVGLDLMVCNSDGSAERESRYLDLFVEQRTCGILISPLHIQVNQVEDARRHGIPVVLLDRPAPASAEKPFTGCLVAVDDRLGGDLATEHLLERGHRRIAFVGGQGKVHQVSERHAGARLALDRAGYGGDKLVHLETTGHAVSDGRAAGQRLAGMSTRRRPTAAFCANDLLAFGLLQELMRQGIRVPDEVAVVGYDDIEFSAAAAVPLSSVRQPRERLGAASAELLLEERGAKDDHLHDQQIFEPELIVRDSSNFKLADRT
jgi:LacI family transcriptional regulator